MGEWRVDVHTARNCVAGLHTPPRFICRTNSVDKVHAQLDGRKKDIFLRGLYDLPPISFA